MEILEENKEKQNDIDETTSIDGDTVQSSITNTSNKNPTTNNNSENNNKDNILLDDDSAIMEIAEKIEDTRKTDRFELQKASCAESP